MSPLGLAAIVLVNAFAVLAAPPAADRTGLPGTLRLQTVPPVAGVSVAVDDGVATSDAEGRLSIAVRNFAGLAQRLSVPAVQVSPDRRVVFDRWRGDPDSGVDGRVVEVGIRTSRLVTLKFLDRFGEEVPAGKVRSVRLRSNTGEIIELSGPQVTVPKWVPESRTQQGPAGLVSKPLYYVVDAAVVGGTSVVNRAQQRFVPRDQREWTVQLLFFKVAFGSTDLFFTRRVGTGIELHRPDGTVDRLPFGPDGTADVPDLPRGTYTVKVYGGGVSFARPVSVSKDQEVSLQVVSTLDLALVGGTVLAVALGLALLGRPHLRPRVPRRWRRPPGGAQSPVPAEAAWRSADHKPAEETDWRPADYPPTDWRPPTYQGGWTPPDRSPRRRLGGAAGVLILLAAALAGPSLRPPDAAARDSAVPVLAYYYIWFNPTSWNRAKIDYPLLGRYSSDDAETMRRHVRMARTAGIDGFLVSWKHTPQLDERLAKLVAVARAEKFRLGIVYQGLDFDRQPVPLETVRADLSLIADTYGDDPVFRIFEKPAVVWTGTDRFDPNQIDSTIRAVRARLLVLGAAKSVEECVANSAVVDGQAYYWSSVDPALGGSRTKLAAMAQAVHQARGVWIAPVAPGFDARLVGGSKTVPRRGGDTLRKSFAAAQSSGPDAIGVISWNEFSENTHVEPSEKYGTTDLNVLAGLLGTGARITPPADSGDTAEEYWGLTAWGALLLIVGAGVLLPVVATRRRRRAAAVADSLRRDLQAASRGGPR